MAQVINTNVASLNSQRQLAKSQSALNQSLERLSSGLRINSAKDDAAGLAISDRMTSQINGLNQAARNANDGISLAQTAEGGLTSIGDSLQRLRALAVQSANSSNSASDRAAINNEAKTLLAEISRVAGATQFNGTNLLDGTFSASQFQVGANANQTISMSIGGASTSQIGAYQQEGVAVNGTAFDGVGLTISANGSTTPTVIGVSVASGSAGNNEITADSAAAKAKAINAKTVDTGVTATASTTVEGAAPTAGGTSTATLSSGVLQINGVSIGAIQGSTSAVTRGTNAATAINAQTQLTGVTAVADASTGALTLTAADGRNIKITSTVLTDAGITAIQNATGLDASAGGAAAGHDTMTVTIGAGGYNETPAANTLSDGDTFTVGGLTYEYNSTGGVTGSNVAITVAHGAGTNAVASATAAAITEQYNLGKTTVSASANTAVVTLTDSQLGNSGMTWAESVNATGGAGALTESAITHGTDATYTAGGVTNYGELTLSSATGFTVGGTAAQIAAAGLNSGSATLTTLSTVDLSTVEGANDAISILDGALSQVDTLRADLGAAQNRFTAVVSNLTTSSENLSASRSRIQDADFAAETAIMSKNNILQQAGTAMLAQANSLPQQVLSLLK